MSRIAKNSIKIEQDVSCRFEKGNFFAKWEAFNPGHSNKDRIALHIIENLEKNLVVFYSLV